MTLEGLCRSLRKLHASTLAAFGRGEGKPLFRADELLAHLQVTAPQVHVLPSQAQQLTPPEPGGDG